MSQHEIPLVKAASPLSVLSALRVRSLLGWGGAFAGAAGVAFFGESRLSLEKSVSPGEAVSIQIDVSEVRHPIPPQIYGLAQPSLVHLKELHPGLWRSGGNPATRFNWVAGNYWNAARDWEFRNGNYGQTKPEDQKPSGTTDGTILAASREGVSTYLTVPTIGWVARDDNNNTRSLGVPGFSGDPVSPGSEAIAGYNPAENRRRVSVRSLPRKGWPFSDSPNRRAEVIYQDEWAAHLVKRFGKANEGGVRYYAMDNEPDLWDITHTDVHPVRPDYNELFAQFRDYASAVKDVDPTAQIGGPVSWGWTGYFFSPRDRGTDNFAFHKDRKSHGDVPFLPWFLKQASAYDQKRGRRTLDILDVHFYPQAGGIYLNAATDAEANARRLRSTRSLWDPEYRDESWINEKVQLIPRLKTWVRENYPGTKIGIMEWNWGADHTLNGALAIAEVLGVFGREGLDLASYWTSPAVNSPGFFAFKIFRNADGHGNGFGDGALDVFQSTAKDRVSCFAARDSKTDEPSILLINKNPQSEEKIRLIFKGKLSSGKFHRTQYTAENLKNLSRLPDITLSGTTVPVSLPAYSLTLLQGVKP